jgi:hypothetical protein
MIFFTNTFNQTLTGLSAVWLTGVACGTGNLSDQRPKSTAPEHFFCIFVLPRILQGFRTLSQTFSVAQPLFRISTSTFFGPVGRFSAPVDRSRSGDATA